MKIGLLGCGGMGITHNLSLKALSEHMDVQVTALADSREDFLEEAGKIWPDAKQYRYGMDLIREGQLDVVHICLPSYLHEEHAVAAMNKGIHVFLEKPACITEAACKNLLEVKSRSSVQVMVGQVLRSFEEYQYLKKVYQEQTFGNLKSIIMHRYSGTANWGFENWFHDESRSGSAVLDLHIHDLDFLRYLLGEPEELQVKATSFSSGVVNHICTQYQFKDVFASAEGIWDISPAIPFEAGFRAYFEGGTVVFRSDQENKLQVYLPDGTSYVPEIHKEFEMIDHSAGINISELGPYYTEIKYFITCLQSGQKPVIATLEDGIQSVRLALEELRLAKEYISNRNTNK